MLSVNFSESFDILSVNFSESLLIPLLCCKITTSASYHIIIIMTEKEGASSDVFHPQEPDTRFLLSYTGQNAATCSWANLGESWVGIDQAFPGKQGERALSGTSHGCHRVICPLPEMGKILTIKINIF